MGRCIGIDLGTTNSVAAIREAMESVRALQNCESQDLTRSVVGEYKKKVRVGELALDCQLEAPTDTIESIKRLMGRGFRDEHVQRTKENVRYCIVEPSNGTDDDLAVIMGGKQYSPIQISAMILEKVKKDAEMRLNDTVEFAVITVPAYFTDKQKDATRKAGQLAGLKVQKLLDEPTAAAIAFGVDNVGAEDSMTILVYDLGGGTFDVSVMTIVNGAFVQLDIEGDMWLGGDDFDRKIMDYVLQHVSTMYGIDGSSDPRFMTKLKSKSEQAKKALSSMTHTEINIPGMLKDDAGNLIDVECDLSRNQFESLIAPQVEKAKQIVLTAIKNSGEAMTPDQIDRVLLVGGSSYIPLVQASLAEIFGREKLMMNIDPMKCVAYGAAILSAKWSEKVECPKGHVNPGKNVVCEIAGCEEPLVTEFVLADGVTGMHYGIRTRAETVRCSKGHENPGQSRHCNMEGCKEKLVGADDRFEIIIPKGSTFPTPEPIKKKFRTSAANLKRLRVPIYAGSDPIASKNNLQSTVWLELPDNVPEDTPVEVAFSIDADGVLGSVVVALLDGSGARIETYLDRGNDLRSRLEKKLDYLNGLKDQMPEELDPDAQEKWEQLYGQATKALSANDPAVAGRCAEEMANLLQNGEPAWKLKAQNLCNYTQIVLGYSFLLDPPKTQQLKKLVNDLQSCIDRNDEAAADAKFSQLDQATDELPAAINVLMMLIRAVNVAAEKNLLVEADKVRAARNEIESAFRSNDYDRGMEKLEDIRLILTKIFDSSNTSSSSVTPGSKMEGMLKGGKQG